MHNDTRRLRVLIRETINDLAVTPDALDALANVKKDPNAALAAWDIIRDPDFYEGLPDDDLERALAGLHDMLKAPPDYVDVDEVHDMIDYVEMLLGYGMGMADVIDVPLV